MHGAKLSELAELVLASYRENGFRSEARICKALDHVVSYFGASTPAETVSSLHVSRYVSFRLGEGAAKATCNRELEALRRGFTLAIRFGLLAARPHIPRLREANARRGFVERDQLARILAALPEHLRPVIRVGFITGWRVRAEILPLTWKQMDFAGGWLRLEPGETKNGDGREFPLILELRATLEELPAQGAYVFPGRAGHVKSFPKSWKRATHKAGLPGLHVHDLRRSAARNMIRAGISPIVVMKLCGWRSFAMLQRYAIVESSLLEEAGEKLSRSLGSSNT